MTSLRNFIILSFFAFYSCNTTPIPDSTEIAQNNDTISDTAPSNQSTTPLDNELDSYTTKIKFDEFLVSTDLMIIDTEGNIEQIQKDTAKIVAEIGESIEGHPIIIQNSSLTNLVVEQSFETSISIMNEGAHCDLIDWEHFYSNWQKLETNNQGQYVCNTYSEKEFQQFPNIPIQSLQKKVKEQCGNKWVKVVKNIKSLTEYPCSIGISRYFLRITGQHMDHGKTISRIIVINVPMGC